MSAAAQAEVVDELYDGLVALLGSQGEAALNWAPLDQEANSIAALVRHVVGSMENWLSRAVSESVQRDRDAEFGYRGSSAELIELVERSRADVHRRLGRFAQLEPSEQIVVRRVMPRPHEARVSRAWCVEHALIHAGEHWGQIQLTAQLHAARPSS